MSENEEIQKESCTEEKNPVFFKEGLPQGDRIKVKMDVAHMFNFLMHHTYFSMIGIIGVLISVFSYAAAIYSYISKLPTNTIFMLILAGSLFSIIQPIMLYTRAKSQVANNNDFKYELTYILLPDKIVVTQGDKRADIVWTQKTKVSVTRLSVLVYVNKTRAFIIPKECITNKENFINIIKERTGKEIKF